MAQELKAETIVPQGSTVSLQMYAKSEVDAVLAEKDAEIRRLQRALWLAREQTAHRFAMLWASHYEEHPELRHIDYTVECRALFQPHKLRFPEEWLLVWQKVERKCRAKAEEYR